MKKANIIDSEKIHKMQIAGFKDLLEKYTDYDTNPGAETLERIKSRFAFDTIDHYFISLHGRNSFGVPERGEDIGCIRIQRLDENVHKLSQMFILPEFQGKGYAQNAIYQAELLYPKAKKWILDIIKQEPKLRYLYEKMGYILTGVEKNIKHGMDLVDYEK